MDNLDIII